MEWSVNGLPFFHTTDLKRCIVELFIKNGKKRNVLVEHKIMSVV